MKKALQISLARTLFTIEEDAYTRLSAYLESVRTHFATTEGRDDIVSDIEGRIAEQFTESGKTIITMSEVDSVIGTMGRAEDLGGESQDGDGAAPSDTPNTKKLYRDTDNAVIGGVSAGLAKYFGINPLWIRLLFVLTTLSTGFGILIYIILWISIPEAKTPSQKLEMSGSPVNLETLSDTMREKLAEVDTRRGSRLARAFDKVGRAFRIIIQGIATKVIPFIRCIIAIALTAAALASIVGLTIGAIVAVTSPFDRYTDFPITDIMPLTNAYGMVAAAYFAIAIPLIFIGAFALSIFRKKNVITPPVGFGLLGLWCLALVALGALGIRSGLSFADYAQKSPRYQTITETIPLEQTVTDIKAVRDARVTVVQGSKQSLVAQGKKTDIDRSVIAPEGGILTLGLKAAAKQCLFCSFEDVHYTLTVQNLSSITAEDGAWVEATLDTPTLLLRTRDGASVSIIGKTATATLDARDGSRIDATLLKAQTLITTVKDGARIISATLYPQTLPTVQHISE